MRNTAKRRPAASGDVLLSLLAAARREAREAMAYAVSLRLEALAIYITDQGMDGQAIAELLRGEAARVQREIQELH